MKTIIGVIKKENFISENFEEVLRDKFTEFSQSNIPYLRITTFEKYAMSNTFEEVFYSEDEFEAWLVDVPYSISKLQAISQLLAIGKYQDLLTALEADETGIKKIFFDAAHQLDRNSNMVNEIAIALDMSEEDINNFFIDASKILV